MPDPQSDRLSVTDTDVLRLKALAHPVRYGIVALIARQGGDLCVCQLQDRFDVSQPTISHHLKILRSAGLVRGRQVGTWVHYGLESGILESLGLRLASLESAVPADAVHEK